MPDYQHHLRLRVSDGSLLPEPEWQYMVHRAVDAERGLDPDSDLFSPGYFSVALEGNQQVSLSADITHAMQDAAGQEPLSADQIAGPFDTEKNARAQSAAYFNPGLE